MSVGVPPQTPLGNLQRSPRLSIAGFKGLTAKGRKDGKERERERTLFATQMNKSIIQL